jgi:hypothetical protein
LNAACTNGLRKESYVEKKKKKKDLPLLVGLLTQELKVVLPCSLCGHELMVEVETNR